MPTKRVKFQFMERVNWKTIINIFTIVVLCESLYWTTSDLLLFNTKTLVYGLEFLYYTLAAFVALILTISLTLLYENIPVLLRNLLLVLIITYVVVCIFHLYTTACDDQKNLNMFYSGIDVLLLAIVGYLLILKIKLIFANL